MYFLIKIYNNLIQLMWTKAPCGYDLVICGLQALVYDDT